MEKEIRHEFEFLEKVDKNYVLNITVTWMDVFNVIKEVNALETYFPYWCLCAFQFWWRDSFLSRAVDWDLKSILDFCFCEFLF